jgi:ribose transport system substrate-binding protein
MKPLNRPRVVACLASATLLVGLVGCTSGDADATANRPTKIETIGLKVQDMSNPFFSAMDKGA